jgi:hypothetical protein
MTFLYIQQCKQWFSYIQQGSSMLSYTRLPKVQKSPILSYRGLHWMERGCLAITFVSSRFVRPTTNLKVVAEKYDPFLTFFLQEQPDFSSLLIIKALHVFLFVTCEISWVGLLISSISIRWTGRNPDILPGFLGLQPSRLCPPTWRWSRASR